MSEQRGILRSAGLVGICTMASRVLGLIREMLMAVFLGTTLASSAFVVAFTIPNLFRRLFGEGALSAAFVPIFSRVLEGEGRPAAAALANRVLTLMTLVLGLITVVIMAGAYVASDTVDSEKASLVFRLLTIMMPYMLFICIVALAMAILNSLGHFLVPALTPVVLNLVWIGGLLIVCADADAPQVVQVRGLAWVILIAGIVQAVIQFPVLAREGIYPAFRSFRGDPRVKEMLLLMAPAALGMGVHQINVLVDRLLAMWVGDWAPAALSYSERLIYLPLGIFATALGTVLLPTFSRQAAQTDHDAIKRTLNDALRHMGLDYASGSGRIGDHSTTRGLCLVSLEWWGSLMNSPLCKHLEL